MKFEITRHKNGYIIKAEDEDEGIVYEEREENEFEGWASFLRVLTDNYGPQDSGRYSEKRIYIKVEPGDKWEPAMGDIYDYYCDKCGNYLDEWEREQKKDKK